MRLSCVNNVDKIIESMKKYYWLVALLPLFGAASCANDTIDEPQNTSAKAGEIAFAPTFDRNTRSASLYDSNNIPSHFTVGAFHIDSVGDRKPFFLGDEYQNQGGQWVNNSGTRYWPDGGSTDFYALVMDQKPASADNDIQWNDMVLKYGSIKTHNLPSPYINHYLIANDARQQYDLLYAVKKNQKRSANPVPLNFRHALAQVVFDAQNVSKNIYVEISGVSIEKLVMDIGVTLPNKTTDAASLDNDSTFAAISPWTYKGYTRGNSFANFDKVGIAGNPDESAAPVPLTTQDASLAMLLSPIQGDVSNPRTYPQYQPNPANPGIGNGGSCLKVNCTIWEVHDPAKGHDPNTDVELWGGKQGAPKELIIPIDITQWQQGKRYIYTLVFGKGNGGYDPATDQPVLTPITYNITVDDFVDVINKVKG